MIEFMKDCKTVRKKAEEIKYIDSKYVDGTCSKIGNNYMKFYCLEESILSYNYG